MSPNQSEIKIQSRSPADLVSNRNLLEAIAASYVAVFDQGKESHFEEDRHTVEEVKARIISHTKAKEDKPTAHLIVATTKWDETIHTAKDGYLQVILDECPVAVIGCLYTETFTKPDDLEKSVISSATMSSKGDEDKDMISQELDQFFASGRIIDHTKLLNVPELWVRQRYRGTTALRLIAELAQKVKDEGVKYDQYLMWTHKYKSNGEVSEIYQLMTNKLKAKVEWEHDNTILMMGKSRTVIWEMGYYKLLTKILKGIKNNERFNWVLKYVPKSLRGLLKSGL